MNETCVDLLHSLFRCGITMTCAALAVLAFQRFVPVSSIRLRRWMWFAVILQGCLLVRVPLTMSIFPAPPTPMASQSLESIEPSSLFERQSVAVVVADVLFNSDIIPAGTRSSLTSRWWGFSWATILVAAWALGIAGLLIRSGRHYFQFLRSLPPIAPVPQEWQDELNSVRSQFEANRSGTQRHVTLRSVPHVGPLLCWHPHGYQLIVPSDIWRLLKSQQRLMILQHELAHLERGDIWKSFALRLLALPHWFNPIAWYIVNQFDDDAEHACDDAIRQGNPQKAIEYARTLLLLGGSRPATFLAPRAIGGHGLAGRIRRLTVSNSRKDSNMKRAVILAGSIGVSLISLLRFQTFADERPVSSAQVVQTIDEPSPSANGSVLSVQLTDGTVQNVSLTNETSAPSSAIPTEAVVDVEVLFKKSLKFAHDSEKLRSHITDLERTFKEESEAAKRDGGDREQKMIELEVSRRRIAEGLRVMEREVYLSTFNSISEEIREYSKEHGIRLVRRRFSNAMTLSTTGTVIVNPAIEAGVSINGSIEGNTIVITSSGASPESTVQQFPLADSPQGNDGHAVLLVDSASIATANAGIGLITASPTPDQLIGISVGNGIGLVSYDENRASLSAADLPANGTRARPFNTIRAAKARVNIHTSAVAASADDSYKRMMQQDVLYSEPGEQCDITQEILIRMNAKFQDGTKTPKP